MSRRRSRRTARPTPEPPAPEAGRRRVPRAALLAAAGLALAGLVVGGLLLLQRSPGAVPPGERVAFPRPRPAPPAAGPVAADFVGAEACGACHQQEYEVWRESTHGRAGGPPSPERVIAPFDGTPIRFRDAVVIPTRTAAGEYAFRVRWEDWPEQVFRVDAVVGGGHMVGGGTQGFLSRFPDGTLRFLAWDFARQQGVWFCNTAARKAEGWVPITPDLALADCVDWPPARVLGDASEFSACQGCHGSQIGFEYDPEEREYRTEFQTLAINCESCHGPGREHAELARSGRLAGTADLRIRSLSALDKDESLSVCFQCHALKDRVEPGYLPGKPLEGHYSLLLPMLGERPFFPDGRVRTFAYQGNHRASDCYLNGSMTCTDCHDPHSQSYRDHNGRPLEGRFSNGQCTSCHASKADRVEAHTFHPSDSPGSRCVSCHMPYLQQPELGHRILYERSDHTIPVPRPAFDQGQGIENACRECHQDRSVEALQQQTDAWWGELKPQKELVRGMIEAAGVSDRGEAAALLLRPEDRFPTAQFMGMARMLEEHLEPDLPEVETEIVERLRRLAASEDLDVRALALASLHFAWGEDPEVRRFLAGELGALGSREAWIRRRWALALGYQGDRYQTTARPREAIAAYRKALEIRPDDPRLLRSLGLSLAAAGQNASAIVAYRRGLAADPRDWLTQVNLGIALERAGDTEGARRAYRDAIDLNPHSALAHFNLGNQRLRGGDPGGAIEYYRRATELEPGLALAHFHLARAYILAGRYPEALSTVRRGLKFEPEDASARQMLRDLEAALAGPAGRR
jgi:tetratricopeptide (TPR) repeat protein